MVEGRSRTKKMKPKKKQQEGILNLQLEAFVSRIVLCFFECSGSFPQNFEHALISYYSFFRNHFFDVMKLQQSNSEPSPTVKKRGKGNLLVFFLLKFFGY